MQQSIKPYGYYTSYGYMGLVGNSFMLFATETEYLADVDN